MALSAARKTKQMGTSTLFDLIEPGVKGNTTIYQGGLVVLNGGWAAPGSAATALLALGRAEQTVKNTGANGAKRVRVTPGCFKWANSGGGDALAANADEGADAWIVDDLTVAKTDGVGARSFAGKVVQVDSDGVWVLTAPWLRPSSLQGQPMGVITVPILLPAIADAAVMVRVKPGFAGRLKSVALMTVDPATTAAKASTLTTKINDVACTGGVLSATTAALDTKGKVLEATAITAGGSFTAAHEITLVASATTTFVEGQALALLRLA